MKFLPAPLLLLLLSSCRQQPNPPQAPLSSPSSPTVTPTRVVSPPQAETFTLNELFKQDEAGCGMTLWEQQNNARSNQFLFAKNIQDDLALMKIDGRFVYLRRSLVSGEEFYGNRTSQTFISEDGSIQVQTDVTLGRRVDESVELDNGTLQVTQNGQTIKFLVKGSAGC